MVSVHDEDTDWIEHLPTPLRASAWIADEMRRAAPEFVRVAEHCVDLRSLLDGVNRTVGDGRRHRAVAELNNNATNDWLDLITDCLSGRGRGALRAARSLFEASLVAPDLLSDASLAERFIAHKAVVANRFTLLDDDLELRTRKSRRAAEHLRKRWARRWESPAAEAVSIYGQAFVRGWDIRSVRERAVDVGREREYEAYRVASATVHGGSGALFGTLLSYPGDVPVHRFGPNLMVCPMALLYGAKSFRIYLRALTTDGIESAADIDQRVDALLGEWVSFEKALGDIDSRLWPPDAPERLRFVAVVEPSDIHRYYLHDADSGTVIAARPDASSQWAHTRLAEVVRDLRRNHPNRQVAQTILVQGASGIPETGAHWRAASDVFPDYSSTFLPVRPNSQVLTPEGAWTVDESGLPRHTDWPDL